MSLSYAINGHVAVLTMDGLAEDATDEEWGVVRALFSSAYRRQCRFLWVIDIRRFNLATALAHLDTTIDTVREARWRSARWCAGLVIVAEADVADALSTLIARIPMMHTPAIVSTVPQMQVAVSALLCTKIYNAAPEGSVSVWKYTAPMARLALFGAALTMASNPPILDATDATKTPATQ
jgi:hypothetical protein